MSEEQSKMKEMTATDAGEPEGLTEHQVGKGEAQSANAVMEPKPVHEGEARPVDPKSADDVLTKRMPGREEADAAVLAESRKHTRRSFVLAGAAAAAGVGLYTWLDLRPEEEMQPDVIRKMFVTNASLSRGLAREDVLAPTYPMKRAETLRVNGMVGIGKELVPDSWRLQMVGVRDDAKRAGYVKDVTAWQYRYTEAKSKEDPGHDTKTDPKLKTAEKMAPASMMAQAKAVEDDNKTGRTPRGMGEAGESDSTLPPGTPGLLLTMEDVTKFPRRELVTQFKCIEGWSQIVHWAGFRLADFLEAYPPALVDGKEPKYVYMETPDGDYYVGYDLKTCRHPQTLLVTEMMGQPLTQFHGAPLRIHMPTKYGYKQIKRIGLISYTNDKPDDYWTKLGYDWYAGL